MYIQHSVCILNRLGMDDSVTDERTGSRMVFNNSTIKCR